MGKPPYTYNNTQLPSTSNAMRNLSLFLTVGVLAVQVAGSSWLPGQRAGMKHFHRKQTITNTVSIQQMA